jgi:hypothetical protein
MHWRDYLQEREGNYMIQCQCDVEKVPMSHMRNYTVYRNGFAIPHLLQEETMHCLYNGTM